MAIEAKHALLLLSVGFLTGIPPAHVLGHELPCLGRTAMADRLADAHGESRRAFGPAGGGGLVELWTSAGGATWTLVVTTPAGASCLVAEGWGWRDDKRRGGPEARPGTNPDSRPTP
jgi:hypothetical protein